ncbi:MAG: hydantoinase/oxoprolinase N-terminal domain-containing protein [Granulosicoccus sp.]
MAYQLGLDTGGTYTDAVLVDDDQKIIATAKSLTTHTDLLIGLTAAVEAIIDGDIAANISLVSLSTTLATNALVEGRGRAVGLILIGFSPSQMLRANLNQALGGDPHVFVAGGHTADGRAICDLDSAACKQFVEENATNVEAFAVCGMFAVRNSAHEIQVRTLIQSMTDKPVSCAHQLSSGLDAPRRALTALLNARLIPMISALLGAANALLRQYDVSAPLMIVKGDGSLISYEVALHTPVETILSGPAASVVGAQFLCDETDLLVSDMGGTTTDVALIREAQPRLDPQGATVGGWRTMVNAVDVRTFGLGGDSAIRFDREQHDFTVGPQRVVPLSLLTLQYPELLSVLEAQLELPNSTTHSAQFVVAHATQANDLTYQQNELFEKIQSGPIAVQSLFKDQTLDRALLKLEQRGIVLRSGFTPSDASHIAGRQSGWETRGASLGAKLLMRYSGENLGMVFDSTCDFADFIIEKVSQASAIALLDAVAAQATQRSGLSESQKELITSGFLAEDPGLISLQTCLNVPIVALGAPASAYYGRAAKLLNTRVELPEHAGVANAIGAVVGTVRQRQLLVITPAGGKRVSVLFPEGPEEFDSLEAGAAAAEEKAMQLATSKADLAGADSVTVSCQRDDTVVTDGQESVFFESKITATAVGRPSRSR